LFALASAAGCANHVPEIFPIGNKTIETGQTLEFEVRAVDGDGDPLEFGIEGLPAGADFNTDLDGYALFVWTPIASDAGPDGRGKEFDVTFKVTDGIDTDSEIVKITVTLGGAGTGAPIFVTPADFTLDLDRADQIQFNIEVRDPDSSSIDLSMVDNPPAGTFETAPGSKLATYRWRPTPEQIADRLVWSIRVSADDHVNPVVFQDIAILIKGGNQKCDGSPPEVTHNELPDQRVAGDYQVQATASDADSAIKTVMLYYLVDLGDGQAGNYEKHTMTNTGGNTWQESIPNPNLQGEATAKVSYYLCAEDDDEAGEGTGCDLRACLPKDGRFSFTAYAPGNNQCTNDGFEPNNGSGSPTASEAGTFRDLKICAGDEDWYRVQIPASHFLGAGIGFTQANGQLELDLYAADGSTLLAGGEHGENQVVVYSEVAQSAQTLLLRVRGGAGVENSYDLVIIVEPYVECSDDSYEPNDQPNDAKIVTEGVYPGLTCCGEPDWYKLDLNQGDGLDVLIEFDTAGGDLDLWVFEPSALSDQTLSCDNAVGCSTTETDDESVSIPSVPLTTTYYIAVGPYQGARNDYDMTVVVTPVQVGCQDDTSEEDDAPAQASDVWDNGPRTGLQICANDEDWFQTLGFAGETLVFDLRFTHAAGDLDLKLYDEGVTPETLPQHLKASSVSSTDNERIEYPVQADGVFFIRVYGYNGAENAYSLEMTIQ
jgi:hypothetical protein